jgi:chemotaxis regulatin CheY-phosphate phosphatase CheZ
MASDLVNVRPEDVKKLAKALERFEQRIKQATKEARHAIDSANWNDPQKAKFEGRYKDFQKRTNSYVEGEVHQMVKSLNQLAAKVEQIQRHRF